MRHSGARIKRFRGIIILFECPDRRQSAGALEIRGLLAVCVLAQQLVDGWFCPRLVRQGVDHWLSDPKQVATSAQGRTSRHGRAPATNRVSRQSRLVEEAIATRFGVAPMKLGGVARGHADLRGLLRNVAGQSDMSAPSQDPDT